ncbi:unnamed protein product [Discosporangium mesarthrocarpum]
MPWVLLGLVLLWEVVQYWRFAAETRGFLDAAEVALASLGTAQGGIGETFTASSGSDEDFVTSGGSAEEGLEGGKAFLQGKLAERFLEIYIRNRFIWPLSWLFGGCR